MTRLEGPTGTARLVVAGRPCCLPVFTTNLPCSKHRALLVPLRRSHKAHRVCVSFFRPYIPRSRQCATSCMGSVRSAAASQPVGQQRHLRFRFCCCLPFRLFSLLLALVVGLRAWCDAVADRHAVVVFRRVLTPHQVVQSGAPFVVFGDGTMCKCNPIAEADLVSTGAPAAPPRRAPHIISYLELFISL